MPDKELFPIEFMLLCRSYKPSNGKYSEWISLTQLIDIGFIPSDNRKIPKAFTLYNAYPNPSSENKTISFEYYLNEPQIAILVIYNLLSQEVARLSPDNSRKGFHKISWNSIDEIGNYVPSGIYFYILETVDWQSSAKKIVILN